MQLAQWSNESNAKAKKTRTSTAAAVARVTVDRAKGAAIRAAGLDRADTGDAESAVMAATAAFEAAKAESGGDVPRLLTRDGKARHDLCIATRAAASIYHGQSRCAQPRFAPVAAASPASAATQSGARRSAVRTSTSCSA